LLRVVVAAAVVVDMVIFVLLLCNINDDDDDDDVDDRQGSKIKYNSSFIQETDEINKILRPPFSAFVAVRTYQFYCTFYSH
jgi:hypothetical protein